MVVRKLKNDDQKINKYPLLQWMNTRQILPFNSSWCDVNFSIIIYMWSIFNFPDDKLKKSKLSTLKKIQKSYNKEIPYLREKIPSLESSISTTNYIFDYEDYDGQRQHLLWRTM
jgi:hypothetical protein